MRGVVAGRRRVPGERTRRAQRTRRQCRQHDDCCFDPYQPFFLSPFHPGPATLGVRTPFRQWLNSPIPAHIAEGCPDWRHAPRSLRDTGSKPAHAAAPMASSARPPSSWYPSSRHLTLLQGSVQGNSNGKDRPGSRRHSLAIPAHRRPRTMPGAALARRGGYLQSRVRLVFCRLPQHLDLGPAEGSVWNSGDVGAERFRSLA
jgi:hypothetical protein